MVLCSDSRFWQRETKIKRLLDRFIVRPVAGGVQGFQQEGSIRQIRPAILAVSGAAVVDLRRIVPLAFVPLLTFDELVRLFDDVVVVAVAVRFGEADHRQTGLVII